MEFFNRAATEEIIAPPVPAKSKKKAPPSCEACGLYKGCRSPKLRYTGEGGKGIMIVGERPSYEDDEKGTLGHGVEHGFLKMVLADMDIDIDADCYYTTVINCAPTKDRSPTAMEIASCRPRLEKLISKLKPRSIILMGEVGYDAIIAPRLSGRIIGTPYTAFMGEHIPDQLYQARITPIWSVASLLERRSYEDGKTSKPMFERDTAYFSMWKKHLAEACTIAPIIIADYKDQCFITFEEADALKWIREAMTWKVMAFDYETTGLKPHRKGHEIVTVSISDGFVSYAFPFFKSQEFLDAWKALMLSPVEKVGQNIAYEMLWTHALLGYYPKNWLWDTMLGQHCLANQKPTGLKFMVYTQFGHPGYDDEVDKYLSPTKDEEERHGANSINQIRLAPLDKLLTYNALDSLYTFKLASMQSASMSEFQYQGYKFFMESAQTLVIAQENGFNIDMAKHTKVQEQLDQLMVEADNLIRGDPVLEQWTKGEFNYQSSTQLSELLFNIMKVKPVGATPGGKPSVDKEALAKMDLPIIDNILHYRKLSKMRDTYISQYAVEAVDGKVHPYFNINRVDTFRSSSSAPNIQNQPKRDKDAKTLLRSFIVPSRGNRIVEYDYRALEVACNCCNSKDPTLIKYLLDPTADMHKASASDCFLLDLDDVSKSLRGEVKGKFVFAEFYGSYYKQVAVDLWETAKTHDLVQHLWDKGIRTFSDFERHIQEAERILWEDRFPVHDAWRKSQWKFYQKHGYVELLSGFRAYGPMKRNNTFNTPVQGAGFHILLWTMNQVNKKILKLDHSKLIGEIHDSCVMDMHDSETDLIDYWYWLYGTQKVREHFDWIIVPLIVEKEQSDVDGSWATMNEVGVLRGDRDGNTC
jgi:uracil-DNA glycosylase family 4